MPGLFRSPEDSQALSDLDLTTETANELGGCGVGAESFASDSGEDETAASAALRRFLQQVRPSGLPRKQLPSRGHGAADFPVLHSARFPAPAPDAFDQVRAWVGKGTGGLNLWMCEHVVRFSLVV